MSIKYKKNVSVNPVRVSKWDTNTIIRWIQSMQEEIEGPSTEQTSYMTKIIKSKRINGLTLSNNSTQPQLSKLFNSQIPDNTLRILRARLNIEKKAWSEREASKVQIRNGKWKPRVGEKIRCIDTRYKKKESFQATIMNMNQQNDIFVHYDGYATTNDQWIPRNEWQTRITIIEKYEIKPKTVPPKTTQTLSQQKDAAAAKRRQLKSSTSVKNIDEPKPPLAKRISVRDDYIPPFVNKIITDWDIDDVGDWIDTLIISTNPQRHGSIQRNKKAMKKVVAANQINGVLLLAYENGGRLYDLIGNTGGVGSPFCNKLWKELTALVIEQKSQMAFATKSAEKWTCQDLQAWVKSLDLQRKARVIAAIDKHVMTGQDFIDLSSKDIAASLEIDEVSANFLYRELSYLKRKPQTQPITDVNDDPLNSQLQYPQQQYSQQPYSQQYDVKQSDVVGYVDNPPKTWGDMFEVGQRVEASDWNRGRLDWYAAIIKDVNKRNKMIQIGWLNDKWADVKFDKWFHTHQIEKRIRDPDTKQPYGANTIDASAGYRVQGSGRGRGGQGVILASSAALTPAWKVKHIDTWTSPELQEWIHTLGLKNKYVKKVVEAISEQEVSGADFNSMSEVSEIMDSFEIKQTPAAQILSSLDIIRVNTKDYNVGQSSNAQQFNTPKKNSGITGLDNLRNTCFINAVIQGVMSYISNISSAFSYKSEQFAPNMLEAFIGVAVVAMQRDAKYGSIAPKSIVKHLRNSDVKFTYGAQGDALSAVSKMIEMLDKDIIVREKKKGKKKDAKKNPAVSWHIEVNEDNDEEEILEGNLLFYNPYESVIREYMHFVERNLFTCMKCGWQEARYDIKEKVLLPLKDHNTTIFVDVYIPSINGDGAVIKGEECVILDYCPIQTLKYQIFQKIATNQGIKFKLTNVDQISIRTIKADRKKLSSQWIEDFDEKDDCAALTHGNKSIFAVVNSNKKNNKYIAVTTFHVRLDKYGNVDSRASYLEFDQVEAGKKAIKSFAKISYTNYPNKHIFFAERIFNGDYECRISHQYATIVVIWTHKDAQKRYNWLQPKGNVDLIWKCEMWNDGDMEKMPKFEDCVDWVADKIAAYKKWAKTLPSNAKKAFEKQWIKDSLEPALEIYSGLASNQKKATDLVFNAFGTGKQTGKKKGKKYLFIQDIGGGFETYCSTKVMDRGAVLKCGGRCKKKCDVFKQETKIVRFPEVLIFAIDRYINDQKFTKVVGYQEYETFDGNKYELYAVCNHSGGLGYGHYWAFVKGIDDNSWYNADDSRISTMHINRVVSQATAILLFYKKTK